MKIELRMEFLISPYCFDSKSSGSDTSKGHSSELMDIEAGNKTLCRSCITFISDNKYRSEAFDSHIHLQTNPAGLCFQCACYKEDNGLSGSLD